MKMFPITESIALPVKTDLFIAGIRERKEHVTFKDTSVQTGLTYFYHVTARDQFNQKGPASNVTKAAAQADTAPPAVTSITPATGHIFGPVNAVNITVQAQDNLALSSIKLQYSANGGANWIDIATRASSGSTTFTWAIDSLNGEVLVRAYALPLVTRATERLFKLTRSTARHLKRRLV